MSRSPSPSTSPNVTWPVVVLAGMRAAVTSVKTPPPELRYRRVCPCDPTTTSTSPSRSTSPKHAEKVVSLLAGRRPGLGRTANCCAGAGTASAVSTVAHSTVLAHDRRSDGLLVTLASFGGHYRTWGSRRAACRAQDNRAVGAT